MEQQWRCPTCGATNVGDGPRCRICKLIPPPGIISPSVTTAYAPPAPAPVPASTGQTYPPPPAMAPPGGWQPAPPGSGYPPPPPPSSYPPPPPGWYPGAPQPRRQRRTWLIVVCIVVPVLALVGIGIVFARGTDPAAAKDRDAAEQALLTPGDLGGPFSEVAHRAFARSRGGLRIEGDPSECQGADDAFESHGQAVVDSALQAQSTFGLQLIVEEIAIADSPESATPFVDALQGTARACLTASLNAQQRASISLAIQPAPAPDLGDRAAAFHGSMGVSGSSVVAEVDILIVQQGRAAVLVAAFDTTASLHGSRLEQIVNKSLVRLVPRFGS